MTEQAAAVIAEVERTVAVALPDVEVVDVVVVSPQGLVRVLIDHPAGVDLDLCSEVTHALDDVRQRFALEVSSPGLDRPLTRPQHWNRAVGASVKVELRELVNGRRRLVGTVVSAGDESAVVRLSDEADDGIEMEIPYARVRRANTIWSPVES